MLINLSPKENYLSKREKHLRWLNKCMYYSLTKKEREECDMCLYKDKSFSHIFTPTKYTGVYASDFDGDIINSWCKQSAYYSNDMRRSFRRKIKKTNESEREKAIRDSWDYWIFGVADNYEQIIEYYNSLNLKGNHVVSSFIVRRHPEYPYSGWRWHKWGRYIGTRKPCCEYLNDEPEIDKVIVFSIYKVF